MPRTPDMDNLAWHCRFNSIELCNTYWGLGLIVSAAAAGVWPCMSTVSTMRMLMCAPSAGCALNMPDSA